MSEECVKMAFEARGDCARQSCRGALALPGLRRTSGGAGCCHRGNGQNSGRSAEADF